jgi:hypothetical protein
MANYPTSASTDANIYVAVNQLTTSLNGSLTSSGDNTGGSGILVTSTTNFPATGFITIDSEAISYTSIDATHFIGIVRGSDGTTAASHVNGATVSHDIVAAHHNVLKEEIKSVESDLITKFNGSGTPRLTIAAGGTNSSTGLANGKAIVSSGGAIVEGSVGIVGTVISNVGALKSSSANPSNTGIVEAASGDAGIGWRNNANNADIALAKNSSDQLTYGGTAFATTSGLLNSQVTGQVLTGLSASLGTITAADSILTGLNKVINARVVQIVIGNFTGQTTVTSSSFSDSGLSVAITPQATANKILILATGMLESENSATTAYATLYRGTTNLGATNGMTQTTNGAAGAFIQSCGSMVYLDSPNTTSATTYKVRIASSNNTNNVDWGAPNSQSAIIVIEIGA